MALRRGRPSRAATPTRRAAVWARAPPASCPPHSCSTPGSVRIRTFSITISSRIGIRSGAACRDLLTGESRKTHPRSALRSLASILPAPETASANHRSARATWHACERPPPHALPESGARPQSASSPPRCASTAPSTYLKAVHMSAPSLAEARDRDWSQICRVTIVRSFKSSYAEF